MKLLRYRVTADFRPYRVWFVSAESEGEARMFISTKHSIPMEELSATIDYV